ncbi:MAG: DUF1223 domain-containing protein [Candidatus Acidiferrum sp.]
MKSTLTLLVLGALLLLTTKADPQTATTPQSVDAKAERIPVVVELFTSEGCSSCPPADTLLSKLATLQPVAGAEIIALEEHVDYWNQDGWVDPFSDAEWTWRQQQYVAKFKGNSPYTPQLVVDGQSQFSGNNPRDAIQAIRVDAQHAKTQVSITAEDSTKKDTEQLEVRVGNASASPDQEPADVWVAVTEQGLQNAVKAGENAGKEVQHAAVVRSLHKIGTLSAKDSSPFDAHQEVKFKSNWKRANLRIVVFVQERKSLRILGAAEARVTG